MALPASGNSISLDQIHVELGESSGSTVALGDTDVRNLASDTSGAIGMDQFFGLSNASNIEDVYSTFVYKGDGSTRSIVNGLNLSGDGGLVWIKNREDTDDHVLVDTIRGVTKVLNANNTNQESTNTDTVTAFNNNGFSLGADAGVNTNNEEYVAWAWKKQAGFFDIVTYTGTDSSTGAQNISHNLGVVPGMIMVKARDKGAPFLVWHRSSINSSAGNTRGSFLEVRDTGQAAQSTSMWNNTDPTSSVFSVGNNGDSNENGKNFIAYLWAHQANDDDAALISCGTYTGNGVSLTDSSAFVSVDVGFEPQFIMIKSMQGVDGNWIALDKMRGMATYKVNGCEELKWDATSNRDDNELVAITTTGFDLITGRESVNKNNSKYIYMAMRNGPMAEPTAGSQVLSIDTVGSAAPFFDSAHPVDMVFQHRTANKFVYARKLHTGEFTIGGTGASGSTNDSEFAFMNGWGDANFGSGSIAFMFHERVKAFTTQAYRGTGSNRTIPHRLGAAPELLIIKNFSQDDDWAVYYGDNTDHLHFNSVGGTSDTSVTGEDSYWNNTSPTSSVFTVGTNHDVNASNEFYFAFMFATLAGVTKVGTVNVTGATDVDCGFSSGSRFVMIKRYNTNGHWLVFDTTSGLVAGNDSYRKMEHNSNVVTNEDVIDPLDAGFSLPSGFLNLTNNGSGDYVFIAIAA